MDRKITVKDSVKATVALFASLYDSLLTNASIQANLA